MIDCHVGTDLGTPGDGRGVDGNLRKKRPWMRGDGHPWALAFLELASQGRLDLISVSFLSAPGLQSG